MCTRENSQTSHRCFCALFHINPSMLIAQFLMKFKWKAFTLCWSYKSSLVYQWNTSRHNIWCSLPYSKYLQVQTNVKLHKDFLCSLLFTSYHGHSTIFMIFKLKPHSLCWSYTSSSVYNRITSRHKHMMLNSRLEICTSADKRSDT